MDSNPQQQFSKEERELNCIFEIEETLKDQKKTIDERYQIIIDVIPQSMNFPLNMEAQMIIGDKIFKTLNFKYTPWVYTKQIFVQNEEVGSITVAYKKLDPSQNSDPFLLSEKNLIKNVTNRLENFILYQELKNIFSDLSSASRNRGQKKEPWKIILETIRKTDPLLFMAFLRKILHLLSARGIDQAKVLLNQSIISTFEDEPIADENVPMKKKKINTYDDYIKEILRLATKHLDSKFLRTKIDEWLLFNKSVPLVKILESDSTSLADISQAIRKYFHLAPEKVRLTEGLIKGLRVSLIRRFFTEDLQFISSAKEFIRLSDFYNLIDNMIYMPTSHGKLGGKSSGLFIANIILREKAEKNEILKQIKTPKTWYMASDSILAFMHYNGLEEMLDYKYKDLSEIKVEYSHVVQMFKNSAFPPELEQGLSSALDDFGDVPLIVRSSSLLEDQVGSSFSGKYKSLFLPNQGTKEEKITALKDAIAEVFSSTFGPDPIEYRAERLLLDFHEEMAVMIQEVVGSKIGKYYLPSFAGVAFSNNEFRWSQRIKREDGLIRIVPGLGTRAVDRIGDDYPILVSPGQPNLRVNVTVEEALKYSPKFVDAINLETNKFETIPIDKIIREFGDDYPALEKMVSLYNDKMLREPFGINTDYSKETCVVTFNGILNNNRFLPKIDAMLRTLQAAFNSPVDIEFAHNGKDLYLLQCRPQSFIRDNSTVTVPEVSNKNDILFETNKFVSNGYLPDIKYVVYVNPLKYAETNDINILIKIGNIVSHLNKILPRRKFILIGPGRWGSRGDIKLGVRVTYSDINNTAMLIEVAKRKGSYTPDLSFGTHFFQDLVEARIGYLPLYPDEESSYLNEEYFSLVNNELDNLLPDFAFMNEYVSVVKFPHSNYQGLDIYMNADDERAIAILNKSLANGNSKTNIKNEKVLLGYKLAKYIKETDFGINSIYLRVSSSSEIRLHFVLEQLEKVDLINIWLNGFVSGHQIKSELKSVFTLVQEVNHDVSPFDNNKYLKLL